MLHGPLAVESGSDLLTMGRRFAIPQRVKCQIIGNREQPSREFGLGRVLCPRFVNTEEHFLSQILGFLSLAEHVLQDRDEPSLITFDKFGEGLGIVVTHQEHEPNVGIESSHPGAGLSGRHGVGSLVLASFPLTPTPLPQGRGERNLSASRQNGVGFSAQLSAGRVDVGSFAFANLDADPGIFQFIDKNAVDPRDRADGTATLRHRSTVSS